MNEHAQEQKLRTNAAKNKVVDPEEIAKAIANLRRVAEAARRRAENQGRAPDKEDGDK